MQKFTRPITREVELNGQRLAVTFDEQGLSVRPVGTRKPPQEVTWADLLTHVLSSAPAPAKASVPPPNPTVPEPAAAAPSAAVAPPPPGQ